MDFHGRVAVGGLVTMRIVLGVIAALIISSTPSYAGQISATGVAPIIDQKVIQARKAALEEAKRAAVEQVLGSYVESRTEVSDFALASDKIYSTVKGRIDKYEVTLDEPQDGDIYRVEILATFEDADLITETEALLKKFHWHKKPRLLVEVQGEGDAASGQFASQLQQGLERQFRRQGFEVFDLKSGNAKRAGFLLEATSYVRANESEYQGIALKNNEASVTASLKRVGSGEIIASTTFSDSKAGGNQARALKGITKEAVRRIYRDLNWELNEEWLKHQGRGTTIVLELSGSDVSARLTLLKNELNRLLRGIQKITTDAASNNSATLSVLYTGWPEQMYDELTSVLDHNPQLGLSIDGLSGNTLQLKVL